MSKSTERHHKNTKRHSYYRTAITGAAAQRQKRRQTTQNNFCCKKNINQDNSGGEIHRREHQPSSSTHPTAPSLQSHHRQASVSMLQRSQCCVGPTSDSIPNQDVPPRCHHQRRRRGGGRQHNRPPILLSSNVWSSPDSATSSLANVLKLFVTVTTFQTSILPALTQHVFLHGGILAFLLSSATVVAGLVKMGGGGAGTVESLSSSLSSLNDEGKDAVGESTNQGSIIRNTDDSDVVKEEDSERNYDDALAKARGLTPPKPTLSVGGEFEFADYWSDNGDLLREAWSILGRQVEIEENYLPLAVEISDKNKEDEQRVQSGELTTTATGVEEEGRNDDDTSSMRQSPKMSRKRMKRRRTVIRDGVIHPPLDNAIKYAWVHPPTRQKESSIQSLLTPVFPDVPSLREDVYQCQLFTVDGIRAIRRYIDLVSPSGGGNEDGNATSSSAWAGIPTRRPNGMNRYGIIIDDTEHHDDHHENAPVLPYSQQHQSSPPPPVDGAVSLPQLTEFYNALVTTYIRPLARMLFQDYIGTNGDDVETFGFTVRYRPDEDVELKEHTDASTVTMNVNLNLPEEMDEYEGSSLYFVDKLGERHEMEFQPGMALFHRGTVRHAAKPIVMSRDHVVGDGDGDGINAVDGSRKKGRAMRQNLIIWFFGRDGFVRIAPYGNDEKGQRLTLEDRWCRDDGEDDDSPCATRRKETGQKRNVFRSSSSSSTWQDDVEWMLDEL